MATFNDLRAVIVQDLNSKKLGKEKAEQMQLDFDQKAGWLRDKLTELLAPLLTDKFGELPLVKVALGLEPVHVTTVSGIAVKLPVLKISVGLKAIQFSPKLDSASNELHYSADLRAGTFCTNESHIWVIRRGDAWGLLAENIVSEFLIAAFQED